MPGSKKIFRGRPNISVVFLIFIAQIKWAIAIWNFLFRKLFFSLFLLTIYGINVITIIQNLKLKDIKKIMKIFF